MSDTKYAAQDTGVNDACVVLKALSADEKMRMEAEDRLKAWRDEMDRLDGARNEGREEGREDERIDTINRMRSKGYSIEQICDLYDMSTEQVKSALDD